jgi:hypothetical protein
MHDSTANLYRGLTVSAEETTDIRVFKETLGRVLQVPKSDLKELLAKEKAANADKPKRGPKPKRTVGYLQQH